jgi:hypothetical protein
MVRASRVNIINALRVTIHALEQDADLRSEHSDLVSLKGILLRRIADLEQDDESVTASTTNTPQTPQ